MKKPVLFILSILIVICLTACSKNEDLNSASEKKEVSATQTVESSTTEDLAAKGDMITFGHYEQDNNPDNGPEPIEWIVLDVQDGKTLLISKYGLDAKLYHSELTDITWEQCTLRAWLNQEFLKTAFNEQEQTAIFTTHVDNSVAQGWNEYKTTGGKDTEDQIFLLSYHEAFESYSISGDAGQCGATDYAIANGAVITSGSDVNGHPVGVWWLRSPGKSQDDVMCVNFVGNHIPMEINFDYYLVRPAMWIELKSDIF